MTEPSDLGRRKRLRVGYQSERRAVNAVRALLDEAGCVVAETEGRSDYGRDLLVDLTSGGEVTGETVGVQVKGDERFVVGEPWHLEATALDLRYWADQTIPMFAVLVDTRSGAMRWSDVTAYARQAGRTPARDARVLVPFPADAAFDLASVATVVQAMKESARVSRTSPAATGRTEEGWLDSLSTAASSSGYDEEVLRRFAVRTRNDIALSGGFLASGIDSSFSVRRHGDLDYWIYDLVTRTSYTNPPEGRAVQHFSVRPSVLRELDGASPETQWPGDESVDAPWLIQIAPLLEAADDWASLQDGCSVWVRAWDSGRRDRASAPRRLSLVAETTGDLAAEYDSAELDPAWDVIEVAFRGIPHSFGLPALSFSRATCVPATGHSARAPPTGR